MGIEPTARRRRAAGFEDQGSHQYLYRLQILTPPTQVAEQHHHGPSHRGAHEQCSRVLLLHGARFGTTQRPAEGLTVLAADLRGYSDSS
jgi:hypothetical protein